MSPVTLDRQNGTWLDSHAARWVEVGLITPEQATGIREYEHAVEPEVQRLPLGIEVASYIGSTLALIGGAAVVGRTWESIPLPGRLGVAVGIMLIGFVAGTWLVHLDEPGTRRLGWFLWTVGTGGVAMASFVVASEFENVEDAGILLAVGLTVLLVGVGLWRNLERPLQFLTAVAGFGMALGGVAVLMDADPWMGSAVLLIAGFTVAGTAVIHKLEPRTLGMAVGALGAYVGGLMLGETIEELGPAVALVIAVGVVALALREGALPLLVLGVLGTLLATSSLLSTVFTGAVAALVVTTLGFVILIGAIAWAMRRQRTQHPGAHG